MLILKGHQKPISEIAFSPDGMKLVSAGRDVRLWDLMTGKQIALQKHFASSVSFYFDGSMVAIAGKKIILWNIEDDFVSDELELLPANPFEWDRIQSLDFSPKGKHLIATITGGFGCWQWKGGRWKLTWNHTGWRDGRVACSPNRPTLAIGSIIKVPNKCNAVDIWNLKTGKRVASIPERGPYWTCRTTSLAYSPDGTMLAGACGRDLVVWDSSTLKEIFCFKSSGTFFQSAAFSPDNQVLAAVNNDKSVRTWDTATWKAGNTYDWEIGKLLDIAYSPDGMRAAACSNTGKIIIWDIVT